MTFRFAPYTMYIRMNGMILLHVLSYLKIQILNGKNI